VWCLFDEDTPRELILDLRPDILVKGADYEVRDIVGAAEVTAAGGRVETITLRPGRSSSDLIRRINEGIGVSLDPTA
jgi:D-beta-D-heptose 7-phosphate kinase/D-beta-D-heptose 1-phosphate adenosyltransferase